LKHFADPDFWFHYRQLPDEIRALADKNFSLLKDDPRHASVRLKKIGILYSARVGYTTERWPGNVPRACNGFGSGTIPFTTGWRIRFEPASVRTMLRDSN